jgi:Family of unknown function (DUF6049)
VSDRVRRLGTALVAAVALAAGLPIAAPASAAPAEPVTVTLQSLEPHDVRPDSTVQVTVLLRNTSADNTGPLTLRLRRGTVLGTRGELQLADTDVPTTGVASGPPQDLAGGLSPGQSQLVRYSTTIADLGLSGFSQLGVYPIALTVQSADGTELGRLATLLPYLPDGIAGTRVTLLWPLLDRPHRVTGSAPGKPEVFTDDLLARSVSPGGRLDRLLNAAVAVTGRVRLTLVVDPETIEALDRMTAPIGYRVMTSAKTTVAGTGAAAAARWLARLRAIAPKHLLVATPYADPDLVALERGGDASLGQFQTPDLDETARVLGVQPSTKVSWPPDGQLTDTALDGVVAQGASAVVLDPTALPRGADAQGGRTPSGVSPLPALSGQALALVSDPMVEGLLARGAAATAGGPRLAEQRLLAELAMITAEAPNDSRTIVLAPPRRWNPSAGYADALVADVSRIPWLAEIDALQAAAGTEPVDRGPLAYPADARRHEITGPQVSTLGSVQSEVDDFRSALDNEDAREVLGPYGDAVRRSGSSAWRGSPAAGQAYVTALLRQIEGLRSGVTMSSSATGDYTLASSDSPLLITLDNRLTVPVNVRIKLTTPAGFEVRDAGVQQIPAGGKRTVKVLASVQRTGTFTVKGQATTPDGGALGNETTLSVRSTAYGGLALGITGVAFVVLVAAVVVRLVRRLRARGGESPVAAGSPADRSLQ